MTFVYPDFVRGELSELLDTETLGRFASSAHFNHRDTVHERVHRKKQLHQDCFAYTLSSTFHEPRKRLKLLAVLHNNGNGIVTAKSDSTRCFRRNKKRLLISTRAAMVARMLMQVKKLNCSSRNVISTAAKRF